jgi:3-isopropylmalate dehydrogenase
MVPRLDRRTKIMRAAIAVLPGDGIGPEVVREALRVLAAVAEKWRHTFSMNEALIGGAAIDRTGSALPPETLAAAREADAVLLGAVGGPKWDDPRAKVRPEQGLLAIRKGLGLYANLRPVKVNDKLLHASPLRPEVLAGVDMMVVRELTGGIYFGDKLRDGDRASDMCVYTVAEVERIVRIAAGIARGRRKKLCSVDKANVLETSRLWREVAERVCKQEFPDVALSHMLVDACAMQLIRKPADFDVIVTENMFGDILTDEASMLTGSMGMLPSASLGEGKRGLYEPIHGSAPDIAGKGIANPYATILSAALLLRHSLGLEAEAIAVESAVGSAIDGGVLTADLVASGARPVSTSAAGDAVLAALAAVAGP